jgi:hypothetical protein
MEEACVMTEWRQLRLVKSEEDLADFPDDYRVLLLHEITLGNIEIATTIVKEVEESDAAGPYIACATDQMKVSLDKINPQKLPEKKIIAYSIIGGRAYPATVIARVQGTDAFITAEQYDEFLS